MTLHWFCQGIRVILADYLAIRVDERRIAGLV
jgi:hypothetical protein